MSCIRCGHREDDHDHVSGNTYRRECEIPKCGCLDMLYEEADGTISGGILPRCETIEEYAAAYLALSKA